MNLKLGWFDWNKYALVITAFFAAFLVAKLSLLPQLPHCLFLTCPYWFVEFKLSMLAFMFLVAGVAGLKASRSFGGRRNFTGRFLFFFALFMFALGPVYDFLGYLDGLPNPISNWLSVNVFLPYSGIDTWGLVLAFCFPAYALAISLRSVWNTYDRKFWLVAFVSLAFVLICGSWFNLVYYDPASGTTTITDTILWVGIYPFLIFVQLVAGVMLTRSLGKWYVNRSITALVVLYLLFGVIYDVVSNIIFTWLAGFGSTNSPYALNLDVAFFYIQVIYNFIFYLVCLTLTQIKPRTTGPYYG